MSIKVSPKAVSCGFTLSSESMLVRCSWNCSLTGLYPRAETTTTRYVLMYNPRLGTLRAIEFAVAYGFPLFCFLDGFGRFCAGSGRYRLECKTGSHGFYRHELLNQLAGSACCSLSTVERPTSLAAASESFPKPCYFIVSSFRCKLFSITRKTFCLTLRVVFDFCCRILIFRAVSSPYSIQHGIG